MTKFILVDNKGELADAWHKEFGQYDNFEIHGGVDILDFSADAIVSPANSFGFMDGGIDLIYSLNMGWHVQRRVQDGIRDMFDGELLIGQALGVPTDYAKFPVLIAAPTMRIPEHLNGTPNVYLAAKAIFLYAKKVPEIKSIVCPGLGTGTGKVSPTECAQRMRAAYEDWYLGNYKFPENLTEAAKKHLEEITT